MTLIKGFKEEPNRQGFNENTLEWQGVKIRDLSKKKLIDIIVHLFTSNLTLQSKLKEHEDRTRIIKPYS